MLPRETSDRRELTAKWAERSAARCRLNTSGDDLELQLFAKLHRRSQQQKKQAIVTPLLKKAGLDAADMANYRPVSNLTFLSKTVERVVAKQLNRYLAANGLLPRLYSPPVDAVILRRRRCYASCPMFLQPPTRSVHVTLLTLVDLSAAFDCVDHDILLMRLRRIVGLSGQVFSWIWSFLTERSQRVAYAGSLSLLIVSLWGVDKALYSGHCCSFCTRPSCSTS